MGLADPMEDMSSMGGAAHACMDLDPYMGCPPVLIGIMVLGDPMGRGAQRKGELRRTRLVSLGPRER